MNWLCCANHHRLTLFFNLKRSVLEHKICQWRLFYLSDTMLTPDFIFKSWVCAVMRVTARFWEVAADLCPHWRPGQWLWWCYFRSVAEKCPYQIETLRLTCCSQHVRDTALKQELRQRMHDSCCSDAELISLSKELEVTKEFSTLWDFLSLSGSSCP